MKEDFKLWLEFELNLSKLETEDFKEVYRIVIKEYLRRLQ